MDKKQENEFKNRLEKETEKITELKEETWNNISRELFPEKTKKIRTNWVKGFAVTIGTAAVAVMMFLVFMTGDFTDETQDNPIQDEPTQGTNGSNAEENDPANIEEETPLKDRFEQEKEIEIELEGMKEPIQVQLATNEELSYIIYVDKDRYQFTLGEEIDEIAFIQEDEQYPEVAMEIQHFTNTTTEEAVSNIIASLENDGMSMVREESVTWPIKAEVIVTEGNETEGSRGDNPIHRYYITEDENKDLYIFKQIFFTVAWEGHAMRFDYMLETFETVE